MQHPCRTLATSIAAAVLVAGSCSAALFPSRCVRVTADPTVGAVTAPLIVEEWQAVDGGVGQLLSRINHRKLVIAPSQQVSVTWPVSNRYVRLPPAGSYLWRSPCADGLARFGLFSTAPDQLSISAGGRTATSVSGVPQLAAPYPLPYGTSRPMGSPASDGSALDVQLSRFVAASGTTVSVAWTPVSASLSEAYVPLPSGGDLPTNVTIAVTVDLDGNGTYTPGEPFGACHMQYADYAAPEVCLTRVHPSIMRIDLASAIQSSSYDDQKMHCDRYLAGYPAPRATTTGLMAPPGSVVRVRLALAALNDRGAYSSGSSAAPTYPSLIGFDRLIDLSERPTIDETVLLETQTRDLGWDSLGGQATRLGLDLVAVHSSRWIYILGYGTTSMSTTNNSISVAFNNYYEDTRTAATPTTPTNTVFHGFPRVAWRQSPAKSFPLPYPVWYLAVYSAQTGGNIVYDQDFASPCLDSVGSYSATLPIMPGALGKNGAEIAATNYWWAVCPLDAKHATSATSTRSQIRLD